MFLKQLIATISILLYIQGTHQTSTPDSSSYIAGVVEFTPEPLTVNLIERTKTHIREYETIIFADRTKDVDIIIFPELTLNDLAFPVYVELDNTPCDEMSKDSNLIDEISCMAKRVSKYIVINISEKIDCGDNAPQQSLNDTRPCSSLGYNRYNTNVVFNRNGTIISKYRKYNLFREPGTNTTLEPDIITFETDFGVTFGQITCFDILFFQPAMQLIAKGVRDFIFPAMWISELPFLTASQIHYSWAYANNVNLLAAGTNLAAAGSTGTGIYAGRLGALTSIMTGKKTRQIFVAEVPKLKRMKISTPLAYAVPQSTINSDEEDDLELGSIKMGRDFLEDFTTIELDTENVYNDKNISICYNNFCCNFELKYSVINSDKGFSYRLVAFEGPRNFADYAYTSVSVCGLMTCANHTTASCGTFTASPESSIRFNYIRISGIFDDADAGTLVMPNTLNTKLLPFNVNDFSFFTISNNVAGESALPPDTVTSTIILQETHSDVLAFGLYARNYDDFVKMEKEPDVTEEPETEATEGPEPEVIDQNTGTGNAVSLTNDKLFILTMYTIYLVLQLIL